MNQAALLRPTNGFPASGMNIAYAIKHIMEVKGDPDEKARATG